MKNTLTIIWLAVFCVGLFAFRPSDWISVSLDNRVSVSLPSQPQEAPMPAPAKVLFAREAAGTYIITTSPLGEDFQGADRKTYYDSVIEGALEGSKGKLGSGKLESRTAFKVGDYDGIDFAISFVRSDNQQKIFIFMHSLIIDKKSYTLQFIPADGKNVEAQRKPFFDSITLKPVAK